MVITTAFLTVSIMACSTPENEAMKSLKEMGITYNTENFLECIDSGNVKAVDFFLKAGMSADETWKGRIPLIEASRRGHTEVALALLDSGAAVNAQDRYGVTALMYAAISGSPGIMDRLIKEGADVNAQDIDGRTALIETLTTENDCPPKIIRALLNAGADPNVTIYGGLTPLMLAATGNSEVINILIEAGADVNARDGRGRTALQRAKFSQENIQVLKNAGAEE